MMEKPKVGDRLFSLNVGNAARRAPQKLTPVKVVKVGRKYFSVASDDHASESHRHMWIEFKLDTWTERTNYTASHCLYRSEQGWLDEREYHKTWDSLRQLFAPFGSSKANLTLGQLRRMVAIVKEGTHAPMDQAVVHGSRHVLHNFFSSEYRMKLLNEDQLRAVLAITEDAKAQDPDPRA